MQASIETYGCELREEKDYWQSASESEKQRNYKNYSITS
jgi:hypothetical protein